MTTEPADVPTRHTPDPSRNTYIAKHYAGRDVLEVALQYGFYLTASCGRWLSPKELAKMSEHPPCGLCAGAA